MRRKWSPVLLLREEQEITTIRSLFASSLSPGTSSSSSTTSSSRSASRCTVSPVSPSPHLAFRNSHQNAYSPSPLSPSPSKSTRTSGDSKWSTPMFPLLICLMLLTECLVVNGKNFKCDFQKHPDSGCQDSITTTCNSETDQCICRPAYPVNVNGRCFAYRDISDLCVTSRQCSKIKAKCIDNAGDEVVVNEETTTTTSTSSPAPSSPPSDLVSRPQESSLRMMVGICKCPDGLFHNPEKNECSVRILGRKCYFNTDCKSCVTRRPRKQSRFLCYSILVVSPFQRTCPSNPSLTDPRILIVSRSFFYYCCSCFFSSLPTHCHTT